MMKSRVTRPGAIPDATMGGLLPPLRLVGATILRDGRLQQRSVSFAGGRIVRGALPPVDLSGYLVLPGIVDMAGAEPVRALLNPAGGTVVTQERLDRAIAGAVRDAARGGITTAFMRQGWGWQGPAAAPALARRVLDAAASLGAAGGTDLRVQLVVDTLAVDEAAPLIAALEQGRVGSVVFASAADALAQMRRAAPEDFARAAAMFGTDPQMLCAAIRARSARRAEAPRLLCRLAEEMDERGVVYGSQADGDGQVREYFSMMGARLALAPAVYAAAAAARAMGDPVVLSARDLLAGAVDAPETAAMLRAGLCDALVSDGRADTPLRAAFALADQGGMDLADAWRLVSAGPAELLRLADRGSFDPGRRADLVVIEPGSRQPVATIAAGRLTAATPAFMARLIPACTAVGHAVAAE